MNKGFYNGLIREIVIGLFMLANDFGKGLFIGGIGLGGVSFGIGYGASAFGDPFVYSPAQRSIFRYVVAKSQPNGWYKYSICICKAGALPLART